MSSFINSTMLMQSLKHSCVLMMMNTPGSRCCTHLFNKTKALSTFTPSFLSYRSRQYSTGATIRSENTGDELLVYPAIDNSSGVQVWGINRPNVRNAISFNLITRLDEEIQKSQFDDSVKVIILKSEARGIFCAGADLRERRDQNDTEYKQWSHGIRAMTVRMSEMPKPILCALDGHALGGGIELALACDIRVAVPSIEVGFPETGLAIIPGAGGTQRLPRLVGPSAALDMILTGRRLSGTEIYHMGLVNYLVEQNTDGDAAFQNALEIAKVILQKGPKAVQLAKMAITKGIQMDLLSGLALEQACYDQIIPTEDRREALDAFKERRPPKFKGI